MQSDLFEDYRPANVAPPFRILPWDHGPGDLVRLVISETRGQASASGSTSYMPYTRRRPLSLSRYGRARGRGRHLLVRVDAAGPPRPRSYKILQPVDGRRRTGGW